MIVDNYDVAEKYLTNYPDEIEHAWGDPARHEAGFLFRSVWMKKEVGCLTEIRRSPEYNITKSRLSGIPGLLKMVKKISEDERIPSHPSDITPESLPVFKEYQRELDVIRNKYAESAS